MKKIDWSLRKHPINYRKASCAHQLVEFYCMRMFEIGLPMRKTDEIVICWFNNKNYQRQHPIILKYLPSAQFTLLETRKLRWFHHESSQKFINSLIRASDKFLTFIFWFIVQFNEGLCFAFFLRPKANEQQTLADHLPKAVSFGLRYFRHCSILTNRKANGPDNTP